MAQLNKGEKAPDFTYSTAFETDKNFYSQLSAKGNILMFSRYIGCTICLMKLMELTAAYSEFEAAGAKVFFVLQSSAETTAPKLEELNVPFDVILNPNESLYKLYDVKAAKSKLGLSSPKLIGMIKKTREMGLAHGEYEGNELQLPALFVIDGEGTIKTAHYAKNLADLPDTAEILKML